MFASPMASLANLSAAKQSYQHRTALYAVNELKIQVSILDVRLRYGQLDLLITPVNGKGEKWVSESKVELS